MLFIDRSEILVQETCLQPSKYLRVVVKIVSIGLLCSKRRQACGIAASEECGSFSGCGVSDVSQWTPEPDQYLPVVCIAYQLSL